MKYPALFQFVRKLSPELPEVEWLKIEPSFVLKTHTKGELPLTSGSLSTRFGIVLSGFFKVSCSDPKGREFVKSFRGPMEFVGPYAEILQRIPSRVEVECLEKGEVIWVPYEMIEKSYTRHPAWETLMRKVAEEHFVTKEQREYEFLTLDAKERYLLFQKQYARYIGKIPQHLTASYLGITPVALSRLVRQGSTSAKKKKA